MRYKTYARKSQESRRKLLDKCLQGESAQRDTTTEKPHVMAAGSIHRAGEEAAEKYPQYLATGIQLRLRAVRVRPAVKDG